MYDYYTKLYIFFFSFISAFFEKTKITAHKLNSLCLIIKKIKKTIFKHNLCIITIHLTSMYVFQRMCARIFDSTIDNSSRKAPRTINLD